jgi:hypothetical protein
VEKSGVPDKKEALAVYYVLSVSTVLMKLLKILQVIPHTTAFLETT